jgi:hypothetical protein
MGWVALCLVILTSSYFCSRIMTASNGRGAWGSSTPRTLNYKKLGVLVPGFYNTYSQTGTRRKKAQLSWFVCIHNRA